MFLNLIKIKYSNKIMIQSLIKAWTWIKNTATSRKSRTAVIEIVSILRLPFDERLTSPIFIVKCLKSIFWEHFYYISIVLRDLTDYVQLSASSLLLINLNIVTQYLQFAKTIRTQFGHSGRTYINSILLFWVTFVGSGLFNSVGLKS